MFALAATPPSRHRRRRGCWSSPTSSASTPAGCACPPGRLLLQLKNIGEDDHDLRILGPRATARAETGIVGPGGLGKIRATLPRGRYTFFCTVADHAERGMKGASPSTVRKAAR